MVVFLSYKFDGLPSDEFPAYCFTICRPTSYCSANYFLSRKIDVDQLANEI